ncbi:FKBP-type peptidyl-prolyl cis-trans isomerase [Arthrobotrys megalospora]
MRFTALAFATFIVACAADSKPVARNAVVIPNEENLKPRPTDLSELDVPELIIEKLEEVPAIECMYKSGPGSIVVTLYNGELINGKLIDKSWDNNDPHQFQLGTPLVIEGLQLAVEDMCVNEVRKVTIPSRLAHGNKISGGGLIPRNAAIVYKIKLIGMKPPMYPNPEYNKAKAAAKATVIDAPPAPSDAPKDEL